MAEVFAAIFVEPDAGVAQLHGDVAVGDGLDAPVVVRSVYAERDRRGGSGDTGERVSLAGT